MNGAPPASGPASVLFGLGTQGSPRQQSALDEQACPAPMQLEYVQRGTPMMSRRHVLCGPVSPPAPLLQLPEQQSHEALQDTSDPSVQMSPFGLQPVGLRQTPRTPASALAPLQVTLPDPGPGYAVEPQQSASDRHTSPTTWQPLAGWQMSTPVGP
jgi:hypothetical protein